MIMTIQTMQGTFLSKNIFVSIFVGFFDAVKKIDLYNKL